MLADFQHLSQLIGALFVQCSSYNSHSVVALSNTGFAWALDHGSVSAHFLGRLPLIRAGTAHRQCRDLQTKTLARDSASCVQREAEFYRKSCAGAQFILRRLDRGPLGGPLLSPPGGLPPAVLPALCLSS